MTLPGVAPVPGSPRVQNGLGERPRRRVQLRSARRARAEMRVVRTSKIKVRKFGSAYRIEPHNKYEERWQELRLDRELSNLWKPSALAERHIDLRLFLFIGFAKEADPFGKELERLEEQLGWGENGASYETSVWADRENRHFFVRLSAWARPNP